MSFWSRFENLPRYFRGMGRGIERRRGRLHRHWQSHLEASKDAERRWCASFKQPQTPSGRLVVLGAGRLYDFDAQYLAPCFQALTLVDADAGSLRSWKRLGSQAAVPPIEALIRDVSGVIDSWRRMFSAALRGRPGWDEALSILCSEQFRAHGEAAGAMPLRGARAVLSLNLLSQLPIVWQDTVERLLVHEFGRRMTAAREQEWLDAFLPSARSLVEDHLRALNASGAPELLLITDLEYAYYRLPSGTSAVSAQEIPIVWGNGAGEESGAWSAAAQASTRSIEVVPALYGIDLRLPSEQERYLPEYHPEHHECWLWHIQPQGFEDRSRGTVHLVGAFAFRERR